MTPQATRPRCFRAGTMLVTLRGEVPAESVRPGDLILTLSGEGAPLKPVTWVGQVEVDLETHPEPMAVRPVRIAAGAIEPGMRVVIHDDLLATGGTAEATIALVRQAGAEPVGACFVAELKGLDGRARLGGLPTLSLVEYDGA